MRTPGSTPEIRIWVFNHLFRGITDQLDYLCLIFSQQGYKVSISKKPSLTGLNLLIENLDEKTLPVVEQFARQCRKRVAVVMTEHVDFSGGKILFHGLPLSEPNEYMHPATKRARLLHLLLAKRYICYFIRLGDLPELIGFGDMMCGTPVLTIPFPRVHTTERSIKGASTKHYDLVFAGGITEYRRRVLSELERKFTVNVLTKPLSRRRRDAAYGGAKVVLNIPQELGWPWISTMRILAAWRCGRPVVNIGSGLKGVLADFCVSVPESESRKAVFDVLLQGPEQVVNEQLKKYGAYVEGCRDMAFPEAAFRVWGIRELGAGSVAPVTRSGDSVNAPLP